MAINLLSNIDGRKLRIFFSYSHKDEMYRDELDKHFTMLKRNGRIETWHDRKIIAGDNWDNTIKEQLEMADIVLLMISVDFLHSEYIWEQELKIVNERYTAEDGIKVVPIFVRPCDTNGFKFMELQGGQRDKQSKLQYISSSLDRDAIYTDIVKEIRELIDTM